MGMSELGPLAYARKMRLSSGPRNRQHRDYSEDTAIQIDKEVKRIVNGGYEKAKHLLAKNRDTLERIRAGAARTGSHRRQQVKLLMEGKPLPEKTAHSSHAPPQARRAPTRKYASGAAASPGIYAR